MSTRTCKTCHEVIYGRSDKIYCSDYCRVKSFNQLKAGDNQRLIRRINASLIKNYKILRELKTKGYVELSERELNVAGFQFDYFTSLSEDKDSKRLLCYNLGLEIVGKELFRIVELCEEESGLIPKRLR